jgi:hypothetical protein
LDQPSYSNTLTDFDSGRNLGLGGRARRLPKKRGKAGIKHKFAADYADNI